MASKKMREKDGHRIPHPTNDIFVLRVARIEGQAHSIHQPRPRALHRVGAAMRILENLLEHLFPEHLPRSRQHDRVRDDRMVLFSSKRSKKKSAIFRSLQKIGRLFVRKIPSNKIACTSFSSPNITVTPLRSAASTNGSNGCTHSTSMSMYTPPTTYNMAMRATSAFLIPAILLYSSK